MKDQGGEFNFFGDIRVRIGMRIDISISTRPMTMKYGKQVHLGDLIHMEPIVQLLVTSSHQDHVMN